MKKEELLSELSSAKEQLKDYKRFIALLKDEDDPERILTKLNETVGRIEMLLKMSELREIAHPKNEALDQRIGKGALVKIRPVAEEYKSKTYLGFYIGDMSRGSSMSIEDDKIQLEWSFHNPAIFVPELGKVIYGMESWWGRIKSEDELSDITDNNIDSLWYVKLLKETLVKED